MSVVGGTSSVAIASNSLPPDIGASRVSVRNVSMLTEWAASTSVISRKEGILAKFRIATPAGVSFTVGGGDYGYELEALTPIDAEIF